MSDEKSCNGCQFRHWIDAAPLPYSVSSSGWGCKLTGGHAIVRCVSYTPKRTQCLPVADARVRSLYCAGRRLRNLRSDCRFPARYGDGAPEFIRLILGDCPSSPHGIELYVWTCQNGRQQPCVSRGKEGVSSKKLDELNNLFDAPSDWS